MFSTDRHVFISHNNFKGIPVTSALEHPADAREALSNLNMWYPGELFTLEPGDDENGLVVTWIPGPMIGPYLTQSLTSALTASAWHW